MVVLAAAGSVTLSSPYDPWVELASFPFQHTLDRGGVIIDNRSDNKP